MFIYAKKVWTGLLIVLASIYLTFLIDVYTIESPLEWGFVFCYFCVATSTINYIRKKKLLTIGKNFLWISAFTSLFLLAAFQNIFLPPQKDITVSLTAAAGEQNTERVGNEVWLTAVSVDGKDVALSQLDVIENKNWNYHSDYDDYVYYPSVEAQENQLTFDLSCKTVDLTFAANTWSGDVVVASSFGQEEKVELYNDNTTVDKLVYRIETARVYCGWEPAIYIAGCFVVLIFIISVFAKIFVRTLKPEEKKSIMKTDFGIKEL